MFKFFGGGKDGGGKEVSAAPAPRVYEKGQKLSDEEKKDLRAQAMANAKMARDAIGNEALDKIMAAMLARENSPMVQARKILDTMDRDRLNDELLAMIRDREKPH